MSELTICQGLGRAFFDLVLPGHLGGPMEFRKAFRIPIEVERDQGTAERLRRITSPFRMRRLKTDPDIASELPEKTVIDDFAGLAREQAALYHWESPMKAALSGKAMLLVDLLGQILECREKVLIFSQYVGGKFPD